MQRQDGICIDVITDLTAAQARWEALERDGAATPFQSFAWISTLARTVGRASFAEIFVLIHENAPVIRRSVAPARPTMRSPPRACNSPIAPATLPA